MALFANPDNFTRGHEVIAYLSDATGYWFGRGIVLIIFVIIVGATLREGNIKKSFAFATFMTFVLAVLLRILGAIDDFTVMLTFVGMVVGIAGLLSENINL